MGAGITEGDVVNVIGTATCIMAIAKNAECVPGVCGVVHGSIHPDYVGVEAGLSACGYLFESLAKRAGTTVEALSAKLGYHRAGQTGLMHLTWDNGDRTVLVNPNLGGVTLGWNLNHTAEDDLFAAIEGTAFHTRIILDRMREHGVPIRASDSWRRHSAEESGAESGLRQRARNAGAGAGATDHQSRLGAVCVSRRRDVQDARGGAEGALPAVPCPPPPPTPLPARPFPPFSRLFFSVFVPRW